MEIKKQKKNDTYDFLLNQIIKGDEADGIPNVLSDDDTFVVEHKRQKPITKKRLEHLTKNNNLYSLEDVDKNKLKRNCTLIDFHYIPEDIRLNIIEEYEKQKENKTSSKILQYFIDKRLNNMIENIQYIV